MAGILDDVGWIQNVIVNKQTGHILDGHLRVTLALRNNEPKVPIVIVDLTPDEEKRALAGFDLVTGMAEIDPQKAVDLAADVLKMPALNDRMKAAMNQLTQIGKKHLGKIAVEADAEREQAEAKYGGIYQLAEDALFDSDNSLGVPRLLPNMLGTDTPHAVWNGKTEFVDGSDMLFVWGKPVPPQASTGTLCLYVEDHHFERVWSDAVKVVGEMIGFGWKQTVAPDFSLWDDDPFAVQLWNKYRSNWVARYWQEAGVKIIPNMKTLISNAWENEEFSRAGLIDVPSIPVGASQCRTMRTDRAKQGYIKELGEAVRWLKPEKVFIYGGLLNKDWLEPALPKGPEWVLLSSWTGQRIEDGLVKRNKMPGAK